MRYVLSIVGLLFVMAGAALLAWPEAGAFEWLDGRQTAVGGPVLVAGAVWFGVGCVLDELAAQRGR